MKRSTRKQLPKMIAAGSFLTACIVGMSTMVIRSMDQQIADVNGCYTDAYQRQSAVIVDASEPRWNETQVRSLRTYFDNQFNELGFNERLSVYTTEGDQVASIVTPRFTVCGQMGAADEMEAINAPIAQAGYQKRQQDKLYTEVFKPALDRLVSQSPEENRRQRNESPIMEMVQSVARSADLSAGDTLIVASDMIQNSESARFCRWQNEMPPFSVFKERAVYQDRLVPQSLAGVDVEVLMLMREGYGQSGLQFCSAEEELRQFWRDYFTDNGVTAPDFIRVRSGAGV